VPERRAFESPALPERFTETELFRTVASISYMGATRACAARARAFGRPCAASRRIVAAAACAAGDIRMGFAEHPRKVGPSMLRS
jgi:hypothetical protein